MIFFFLLLRLSPPFLYFSAVILGYLGGNEDVEQQEMDRERASLFEDVAHVAVAAGGAAAPLSVLVALGGFDGRRRSGAAVTGVAKAVAKIHASVAKRRAVKAIRSKREARASESPMATTAARLGPTTAARLEARAHHRSQCTSPLRAYSHVAKGAVKWDSWS